MTYQNKMKFTRQSKNLKILQCRQLPNICQHSNLQENRKVIFWDAHYHTDYLEFTIIYLQRCSSSFLFNRSLVFSISSLELFSHHASVALVSINTFLNFFRFVFLVSFPQNNYMNDIRYLLIKVNNLKADNPLYLTQNVFYLTNREALTVPCSVVKHARSGSSTKKKCREKHETQYNKPIRIVVITVQISDWLYKTKAVRNVKPSKFTFCNSFN